MADPLCVTTTETLLMLWCWLTISGLQRKRWFCNSPSLLSEPPTLYEDLELPTQSSIISSSHTGGPAETQGLLLVFFGFTCYFETGICGILRWKLSMLLYIIRIAIVLLSTENISNSILGTVWLKTRKVYGFYFSNRWHFKIHCRL